MMDIYLSGCLYSMGFMIAVFDKEKDTWKNTCIFVFFVFLSWLSVGLFTGFALKKFFDEQEG